ncbi:hypothetical protein NBRGN_031_00510 [Nocardia brasiliensis NBRC 14402]|nr:hypothetical protein CEQ30_38030 [Nocardia brasiliensis]GAJ80855.1 hypothetical protein NBRGN_031_00510 [Nocardia brasiliensis NBRC 14402]SUB53105.1 Uncharacterised protein [Nocardia brasiliensis]
MCFRGSVTESSASGSRCRRAHGRARRNRAHADANFPHDRNSFSSARFGAEPGGGNQVEEKVSGAELRSAVAIITELVPLGDTELDGQRTEELAGRFTTVRPFLPRLMCAIAFVATADGAPVLAAMRALGELITVLEIA